MRGNRLWPSVEPCAAADGPGDTRFLTLGSNFRVRLLLSVGVLPRCLLVLGGTCGERRSDLVSPAGPGSSLHLVIGIGTGNTIGF